jgi:cytidine deaminase
MGRKDSFMEELIKEAKEARKIAHVPYSNYMVGAALKTKDGKIYRGCNVENHGIMSICAERVAFTKAISSGEREFESILVVGAPKDSDILEFTTPCGYCRQFMSEFVDESFKIYVCYGNDEIKEYHIKDLLPHSFCLENE